MTGPGPLPDRDGAIARRLEDVRRRIRDACDRVGREPSAVGIVAVTKTHPPEVVRATLDAGLTDVGESRVQEMIAKMKRVPGDGGAGPFWHLVGRLQSNKAKDVVGRAVLVHSVGRRSLADELSRRAGRAGVVQRVLLQVNVSQDPAKGGAPPEQTMDLLSYLRDLPHLAVEGLMTIPPLPDPAADAGEEARPHFRRLRELRDQARERWPEIAHLSMGMSADFEVAVEEGATIVRLGTVLLGPRGDHPYRPPAGVPVLEEDR